MVDYEVVLYFGFEYGVNVPPKVRRVHKAASVERQGVCWNEAVNGGLDWRGGVVGLAMRTKSVLQISTSDAWLCTLSKSGVINRTSNPPESI
jgi:hypothetical protein